MTSVSAGHIILTPTQPVKSGRPQGESNALPTELSRPLKESIERIHMIERNRKNCSNTLKPPPKLNVKPMIH